MRNNYLIPANTKKGTLIFNYFRPVDLVIALVGAFTTIILFIIFSNSSSNLFIIIKLLPILIAGLLVFPLPPYYHNVLVFLQSMYYFYTGRQKYYWRGWCSNVREKR